MFHSFKHLACIDCNSSLVKLTLELECGIKFSSCGVLQNDIYSFGVEKEAIHLKDILMLDVAVNLDLSPELVDDFLIFQLFFG